MEEECLYYTRNAETLQSHKGLLMLVLDLEHRPSLWPYLKMLPCNSFKLYRCTGLSPVNSPLSLSQEMQQVFCPWYILINHLGEGALANQAKMRALEKSKSAKGKGRGCWPPPIKLFLVGPCRFLFIGGQ